MNKIDGLTNDNVKDNLEGLKQIFPSVFKEDKIDFVALQELLGQHIATEKEQYSFTWNGKIEAERLAQKRSTATLIPCKDESKNWDATENLYIEGDNLEVLRVLQKSYQNQIKMIYIDPPYNTGNDFVYKDNFADNISNYKEITGQASRTNPETAGRYHTNWLNMIYPRLKLARTLLKPDGVIFISIDDNEIANLRKVCDEIFGEDNFIAQVVWKRKRGRDNSARWFSKSHEYLLVYSKNKNLFDTNFLELDEETKKAYKNPDDDIRGDYRMLGTWARGTQGGVKYDFTTKDGQYFSERLWLFSKENLSKLDEDNKLIIRGDNIYRKLFITENQGKIPETIWDNVSNAANASDEIKKLFDNIVFDTPKPVPYIKEMLKIATDKTSIILDFFAGSSTTSQAVMELNAEDGGNRKFILVQLPELTDEKSEAYKAGYKNICEIGKERIRRAGEKLTDILYENRNPIEKNILNILSESPFDIKSKFIEKDHRKTSTVDTGFKVFKLDSSNLKKWDNSPTNDVNILIERVQQSMDYLQDDRTEIDLVYEIMLKYGINLTLPIDEVELSGYKGYLINGQEYKLFVCTSPNLSIEAIEEFSNLSVGTYIFADRCFGDDNALINTEELLKSKNKEMRLF